MLVTGEPARIDETVRLADATALVRDLVNTPAGDLGPGRARAGGPGGGDRSARVIGSRRRGAGKGYPLIAAVGRRAAPERAPRLIELDWGKPDHPRIAIVGKGVCFDSGGLDIKPAAACG